MKYFSTRDKSLKFSFKDIFLRGLAPDGGLFLPTEIRKYIASRHNPNAFLHPGVAKYIAEHNLYL